MGDVRSETRLRSRGHFHVFRGSEWVEAALIDTSPSGMGLDVPCPFEPGETVRLVCNGIEVGDGIVRHCQARKNRFAIGIAIL